MTTGSNKSPRAGILALLKAWWHSLRASHRLRYTRLIGIVVVIAYLALMKLGAHNVRPDHFFFTMLIFVLFMGERRNFLLHWGPFALFWFNYDMLRGMPGYIATRVNVENVYNTEIKVLGWLLDGKIPTFVLQEYRAEHAGEWFVKVINLICGGFYANHFTLTLLLGWLLYWKVEDKTLFRQFAFTFVVTSYAALATFILFPAAPPWWVWKHSPEGGPLCFKQPTIIDWEVSAAGLIDVDRILRFNFFTTAYKMFNPNPFAAVPSLHAAYSVCLAVFATRKFGKKGAVLWVWPIGMWFSSLWLNHHYIIDLLLGLIYLVPFYTLSLRIFKPKAPSKDCT